MVQTDVAILFIFYCRFERFNNIVSSLQVFQKRPTSAVQMYKMIKQNIETKCMNDLDEMIGEAGFPSKFQQLSQIMEHNAPYVGEKAWLVSRHHFFLLIKRGSSIR